MQARDVQELKCRLLSLRIQRRCTAENFIASMVVV